MTLPAKIVPHTRTRKGQSAAEVAAALEALAARKKPHAALHAHSKPVMDLLRKAHSGLLSGTVRVPHEVCNWCLAQHLVIQRAERTTFRNGTVAASPRPARKSYPALTITTEGLNILKDIFLTGKIQHKPENRNFGESLHVKNQGS